MKKRKFFIIIVVLFILACIVYKSNNNVLENEPFPRVVINELHFRTSYSFKYVNEPDPSLICGTIKFYTNGVPNEHEETNFLPFLNKPYVLIDNILLVCFDSEENNNSNKKWIELIEMNIE